MKKMWCLLLVLSLFLLSGCGDSVWDEPVLEAGEKPLSVHTQVTIAPYTEEPIIAHCDAIVRGTVTKKAYPDLVTFVNDDGVVEEVLPCTIDYITVTECLKGELKAGDQISLWRYGNGITHIDGTLTDFGGDYFKVDEEVLLFLEQAKEEFYKKYNAKQYARDKMIPYFTAYQATYWVDEDGTLLHERNTSGYSLFTDCRTVEEMKEKYFQ